MPDITAAKYEHALALTVVPVFFLQACRDRADGDRLWACLGLSTHVSTHVSTHMSLSRHMSLHTSVGMSLGMSLCMPVGMSLHMSLRMSLGMSLGMHEHALALTVLFFLPACRERPFTVGEFCGPTAVG